MKALSLCEQFCPNEITIIPTKKIGEGSDGEVFEIANDSEKVIKFCIIYESMSCDLEQHYKQSCAVINHLIKCPEPAYAHVYAHKYMGTFKNDILNHKQKFILHYYLMEKLEKISDDEIKMFHSILSHEDRGIKKNFSLEKIQKMLLGLRRGLDFSVEKVIFFSQCLKSSSVNHNDIHPRNIMKDLSGNFKLIDFDRAQLNWR
jgi:serine/threonine protein kinase